MKKQMAVFVVIFLTFVISGCNSNIAASDHRDIPPEVEASEAVTVEKIWTKEEIKSLFTRSDNLKNHMIIDCVVIPDVAYDRVGAVLFSDNEKQTSNVAFFDADGHFQTVGIYAQTSADSELVYDGNGTVSFELITDEGIAYTCRLSILIEGGNVNFVIQDNLKDVL